VGCSSWLDLLDLFEFGYVSTACKQRIAVTAH